MTIFLPCLLERWSSDANGEGRGRGSLNTWQDVRRDVIRNLTWLLNTEFPVLLAGSSPPDAVANSALCFGIAPYSGRPQSSMNPDDIAWSIRERIIAFETRLDHNSLEVNISDANGRQRFNKMRFQVRGLLRSDPYPQEFVVQTELDMESGQAKVVG
jgi:type VI secretion system protein ImpF